MKINYKYLTIVLIILIVGIGAYFIGTNYNSKSSPVEDKGDIVAKVNGQVIYQSQVDAIQSQVLQQTGQTINDSIALNAVIGEELLLQEAEKSNIAPTNEEIEKQIEANIALTGGNIEDLKAQAREAGMDFNKIVENYKRQVIIQEISSKILSTENFNVTEKEKLDFYNDNKEEAVNAGYNVSSYTELEPQIETYLYQQKQQKALSLYLNELKENSDIEIY